jgi:hypothetical protein
MQIEEAREVGHMFPQAYCVAKPAPGCAVFVTPWMDTLPLKPGRLGRGAAGRTGLLQPSDVVAIHQSYACTPTFSSSEIVRGGVSAVQVGDWCALVYVITKRGGEWYAFKLEK